MHAALLRALLAAGLAVKQMNLAATGEITGVAVQPVDCVRLATSNFRSAWARATNCWMVEVTGDKSHGGGVVVRWADGRLEPFW